MSSGVTRSSDHLGGPSTSGGGNSIVGVSGALSFMGCVREASPPPHDHNCHTSVMEDIDVHRRDNTLVKEPKKRRFHPLRGLRRIFRRKSRNAADTRIISSRGDDRESDHIIENRVELTNVRHPVDRIEEIRSKSASELLTDTCDRQSIFLRRKGVDESFSKLRGTSGQLSVSHDSIFSGDVPHIRPLSSLETLTHVERRQGKASDESIHHEYNSRGLLNHRISFRVLEQIKTAIENRHHVTSAECSNVSNASRECYQQETTENYFTRGDKRERIRVSDEGRNREYNVNDNENWEQRWQETRMIHRDAVDEITVPLRADLPELESTSLNHTAAHHRISVRPKNRRPPRRSTSTGEQITNSTTAGTTVTIIAENSDTWDSLEPVISNNDTISNVITSVEMKNTSMICKTSSRASRICDVSEEIDPKLSKTSGSLASLSPDSLDLSSPKLIMDNSDTGDDHEAKCAVQKSSNRTSKNSRDELEILEMHSPKKTLSMVNKYVKSSDNLVSSFSKSSEGFNKLIENKQVIPTSGKLQNFISKSTDGFNTLPEHTEVKSAVKKIASKSIETFDNLREPRDSVNRGRYYYSNQLTNKTHIVSKSSDSLEAVVETPLVNDDSIEYRRSSFEIWPNRNIKVISMSSENFDALERSQHFEKRSSVSDVRLSGITRHVSRVTNKNISKSTENFDTVSTKSNEKEFKNISSGDKDCGRISRRTIGLESFDNHEFEDNMENRKIRKAPKKIYNSNMIDVLCENNIFKDSKRPATVKKPISSRFRRSSDSSELGSTDTLNSEKQQKLFDSTETIDSLEKDSENDGKIEQYHDNDITLTTASESDSDGNNANNTSNEINENNGDNLEKTTSLMSNDESFWRPRSDSKENIDIHQLLAITIVSRMSDNSNNQRNSAPFPKKKITSPPTSPVVKQEGNKLLFNNLLVNNNDNEELQNMLNGNISEVSMDTKSFKEKLIMFEKLGK
ncbi:hypothetical protein PV327_004899 [Microctonus hyperodae]|uniref:Uncharacterized protein n=1 Tax=Microctonus hyperodae TaxID=165561 RepID=A0AA39FDK6_MICHY|nr:hypothetical protein PV327_004899 [Microctonus hyperodae]